MIVNILAIGDVCGALGVSMLARTLPTLRRDRKIAFCVVNGENADNLGISPQNADMLFAHGADVITLGNHTWGRREIVPYLDENRYILRPANLAPQLAGRGWGVFDANFGEVCVINLLGRHNMDILTDNPFFELDRILQKPEVARCAVKLIDFHADATSERLAMGRYCAGRASAVWGTHTHVQTSDAGLFGTTGYISDLGMTGAENSILGMNIDQAISRFLGEPRSRMDSGDGNGKLEGAIFEIDSASGQCLSVEAIRITGGAR